MNDHTNCFIIREYQAHNRKIYSCNDPITKKSSLRISLEHLHKSNLNKSKKFLNELEGYSAIKYILNVFNYKFRKCLRIESQFYNNVMWIECEDYKIVENLGNIKIENFEQFCFEFFKLFEYFQRKNYDFIMILARNLRYVAINGEMSFVICPFTEELTICETLTHSLLCSDKYFKLLPGLNDICESELNYNKIAVFILGLKIYEIAIRKELSENETIDSIIDLLNSNSAYWISNVLLKMLEINEDARVDFTQLLEIVQCSICKVLKSVNSAFCQACMCSQCGKNPKFDSSTCCKNLCVDCMNSSLYCSDCEHFSLNHEDAPDPEPKSLALCLCGKNWVSNGNKLICDCGDYCLYCKIEQHNKPCYLNFPKTLSIICEYCRIPAKRCINTFYYACDTCQSDICIVCYNQVKTTSHSKCVKKLTTMTNE